MLRMFLMVVMMVLRKNDAFFSMWDSKEKYDAYLQWRVETGVMKEAEEFMDSEPIFSFSKIEKLY